MSHYISLCGILAYLCWWAYHWLYGQIKILKRVNNDKNGCQLNHVNVAYVKRQLITQHQNGRKILGPSYRSSPCIPKSSLYRGEPTVQSMHSDIGLRDCRFYSRSARPYILTRLLPPSVQLIYISWSETGDASFVTPRWPEVECLCRATFWPACKMLAIKTALPHGLAQRAFTCVLWLAHNNRYIRTAISATAVCFHL